MLVFVYGTLKRLEPNNHWLTNEDNGSSKFICPGKLAIKYPLVIASRYNIPFLLDKSEDGENVEGEVYEIDDKMLAALDILEEYPKLYTRREEEILVSKEVNKDGQIKAWTYFLTSFRSELLSLPHLSSYASEGPHNLPYVARYLRAQTVDHRTEVKIMA